MAEDRTIAPEETPEGGRNFIHTFIEEDIGPGGQ